ncbi:MAG: gfo/Idh/MocA family oxidoreductase [Planctomycetota bacterium]|nr:MAG: gfo/Idh/MocA family oxidoreductase [Planctomycetota bacterium]
MSANQADGTVHVALVGCGQIADAHLTQLRYVPGVRVVAVCDRHPELAEQAAMRFGVPHWFCDLEAMLAGPRIDAVHVTTPAQSHGSLAMRLLDAGVHVYVEKPFTVDAAEAERVLQAAERAGRLVCVGHDQSWDPIWRQALRCARDGELGRVRHVESLLGYPLDGPFGRLVAADPEHWARRLPGGLFHNTISHPLYRITDLMPDEHPGVLAEWFSLHEYGFATELRVLLRGRDMSGALTFTSAIRPHARITRIYGSRASLEVDLDAQVIRRYRTPRSPGAFAKLEIPARQLREAAVNLWTNLRRFLRCDIHYFAGMRALFTEFHAAVRNGGPPPIAYAEILRVTRLMDRIFAECEAHATGAPVRNGPEPAPDDSDARDTLRRVADRQAAADPAERITETGQADGRLEEVRQ